MTKYGLLIGINYIGTENELRGCINDVTNMKEQLIQNHGFQEENIIMLTDHTEKQPTRENIIAALEYIASLPLTLFFFHYSGHGSYTTDANRDEIDSRDECLCPIDNSSIVDDDLKTIFEKIKSPIFCLFDCCHSGTNLDLGYQYAFMKHKWIAESSSSGEQPIIMISGCTDKQTSADAFIDGLYQGAMTYAYITCMNRYKNRPTLLQLMLGMRNILRIGGFQQLPQMNSNKKLDINITWL